MNDKTELYFEGTESDRAFLISFLGSHGITAHVNKLSSGRGPAGLIVHPDHADAARNLIQEFNEAHAGKVINPQAYRKNQWVFAILLLICIAAIVILMHQVHVFSF